MFFIRHILPIIILSGIVAFAIMTIMQRPAEKPEIKIINSAISKPIKPAAHQMAVAAKTPLTAPKPVVQPPKIQSEVKIIDKPSTGTALVPEGVSVNIVTSGSDITPAVTRERKTQPVSLQPQPDQTVDTETQQVTVLAGDLLTGIALRQYGRAEYYHAIYAANRDRLANPDSLIPGQILNIPSIERAKEVYENYKASLLKP